MSSSASASAYWRVAGMSYLKYSGLCADMVRAALKEPAKTKSKTREVVFFRRAEWKNGQPQKQGGLPQLHLSGRSLMPVTLLPAFLVHCMHAEPFVELLTLACCTAVVTDFSPEGVQAKA